MRRADRQIRTHHAVVLGSGMAGLSAAAVLVGHFDRVTLVERDTVSPLTSGQGHRGVPQSSHAHGLAFSAVQQLERLFPGLFRQCVTAGAVQMEAGSQGRAIYHGHTLRQAPSDINTLLATRPFLEYEVRRRVLELPRITLRENTEAAGLIADASGDVRGVQVCPAGMTALAPENLEADLVVDATGRGARSGAWLERLGHPRAPEERVKADVTYASRHFALSPDVLGNDRVVLVGATSAQPRGLIFAAQERNTWVLSLQGYGNHRPPGDPAGFLAYAAAVAPQDITHHLHTATPVDEITFHRFPCGIRRRYDKLHGFPAGLLVIGDALCSVNPVYGSGTALAVGQANALDTCLNRPDGSLARRYFRAAHRVTNLPWWLAACGDYSLTRQGKRSRLLGNGFQRLMAAAERDPRTASAVLKSLLLVESPLSLTRPHILRQILTPARVRQVSPA
ncbi:2-polyprenyl-6-methoxyphenol hydroxylase-like FAD-dependent oxidoreductase [Streptomyces sp. 2132.2]|uniref:FAD-dependent oxidoreductase n=1 Tax=Streptomyces sp. 2132.2 TaxID=2485161 RepID=UPI000F47B7A1|nr:FAD-binding monooxygenase [Streptomyces sp. 2132.2]ROQ94428.1 2-polyprenyl-6-methoxyphenol hydroxylase-like FAD-dependent oxidoreductase [Streptomyces sp. 2132.2]